LPIEKGARENMIVWLFGKGGDVRFAEYAEAERMGVEERWGANISGHGGGGERQWWGGGGEAGEL
jgi:hypothetical protein